MKNIYWIKIDVWCKHPFQDEIDYRYIEFHNKVRHNHKTKLDFTCDSLIVNGDSCLLIIEKYKENEDK